MKNRIVLFVLMLLFFSITYAEEKNETLPSIEPDTITPASASFFLTIPKIARAIDFVNIQSNNLNLNRMLNNFKWIRLLKEKADLDILNARALSGIGIDTGKPIYLAGLGYEKNGPGSVLFLPVTDRKNFGFNIAKLFKKIADNDNVIDLNPAINLYKDSRVFQIAPDILFTVIDDYFVLASSGELLSGIINLKSEGGISLNTDPLYKDYKMKFVINESNIMDIFIKKGFISSSYEKIQAVAEKSINSSDKQKNNAENNRKDNVIYPDVKNSDEERLLEKQFNLDFINYISLSINNKNDEIQLNTGLSVNKDNIYGDLLMKIITTGLFDKALFDNNPVGYHFLSVDINKINEYIAGISLKYPGILNKYNAFKKSKFGSEFFEGAILPCSKSFINIIIKKDESTGEDIFIGYIPMKECGDIEKTLKILKNRIKDKYSMNDGFGEEKINGESSFWFKGENDDKIYITGFKGNIYIGNNINLIGNVINSSGKRSIDIQREFIKKADKNTFLLSYSQFNDESFLKAILMMLAFKKDQSIYSFINKIESLNLVGRKIDNYLLLNLNIKIMESQ